jgi:radical SAM protein with 4Fe4S-binding SPASM domain
MESTNRTWQRHIRAKGIIPFFLDRLQSHALSSGWQFAKGPFEFSVNERNSDDELSRMFFEWQEEFPYEFYIEITNRCNIDCIMCARNTMTRKQGTMTFELFTKIIDEIIEKQPFAYLHYYGIGESTVDTKLFKKLEYARDKGICNSLLGTNGQLLLRNDNYKRLAECGLSTIQVDLDGFSEEVYKQIRVGGDFHRVKTGIEKLYDHIRQNNLGTRVEIPYHIYPGISEPDMEPFRDWCEANDFEYKFVTMHTWAGTRDDISRSDVEGLTDPSRGTRENPCSSLWHGFTIAWDGRIPVCFQDADTADQLGDISQTSIEEVWKNGHFKKRRSQVQGEFTGLCKNCDSATEVRLPEFNSALYPGSLRA